LAEVGQFWFNFQEEIVVLGSVFWQLFSVWSRTEFDCKNWQYEYRRLLHASHRENKLVFRIIKYYYIPRSAIS